MSDKTCGTCGKAETPIIICVKIEDGKRIVCGLYSKDEPACKHWTERTDSVEQVALDMLNSYAEFTREQGAKYRDVARGAMACNEFFDRLRELGVEA